MTFEERLQHFQNNLKIRRLRRRCYEAIDKIRDGNAALEAVNREVKEM